MKQTVLIGLVCALIGYGVARIQYYNGNPIVEQCAMSVKQGNIINNQLMLSMYPYAYKVGVPEYIERDFEAGANFICAAIKFAYGRDLCAEEPIHWY